MKDIASILSKVDAEEMLTKEDAVTLLKSMETKDTFSRRLD